MVNTPIPGSLKSEAKKAAKILTSFTIPSAKVGPDKIIPAGLVENAAGLAILTVVKVGFLVTARGGSGIVIARTQHGDWSAPSAIGIAGLGGGFELGAEVTDFVIILNKQSAVDAFSKGGNLTLGGNFTIAAGPVGRNLEGDIAVRSPAAIYTYSKTKGLFAGISVEGSALIERKDANKKFYGEAIRAYDILGGEVHPPVSCVELYKVLDKHKEMYDKALVAQAKTLARRQAAKGAERISKRSFRITKTRKTTSAGHEGRRSTFYTDKDDVGEYSEAPPVKKTTKTTYFRKTTVTTKSSVTGKHSSMWEEENSAKSPDPWESDAWGDMEVQDKAVEASKVTSSPVTKVRALWSFTPEMDCDITFEEGDEFEVLTRTDTQEDWWEGQHNGKVGIFPANYVQVC